MKCNMKTIMKIGTGVIVLLALAYAALPQIRPMLAGASPLLFVLLCPLSMLFMMKSMQSDHEQTRAPAQTPPPPASQRSEANAE